MCTVCTYYYYILCILKLKLAKILLLTSTIGVVQLTSKNIDENSKEDIFLNDDNIEESMSNSELVNNMDIFCIPAEERGEVIDFAQYFLNIDLLKYPEQAGKVIHCITAPLPPNWEKIEDKDGDYYYCKELNISQYSHPLDFYYRKYLKDEKKKLKKGCSVM